MLLSPPYLQQGDRVVILSTARKITIAELEPAIALYESWGLVVTLGATIGLEHNQYAGSDAQRQLDFQAAIDDPSIRAIFCARGGYGTVRMMDDLDWTGMLQSPKWLVGFSDVTYLHIHLNQSIGIETIHSSVPALYHRNTPLAIDTIRQQLMGEPMTFDITPHPLNRSGSASGSLIGGNLSILYSITGTKSGFNTEGKILVIEDIDEYLYHIDRMMMNLKRSGKLSHLAGLIVGGMTDMNDNPIPFGKNAEAIIAEHVSEYSYPICFGFPVGHISDNRAIILGRNMEMKVSEEGTSLN